MEHLAETPAIQNNATKARVLKHRDVTGRPVIYIPAKNHNSSERDIDELTKFVIILILCLYVLKSMSKLFRLCIAWKNPLSDALRK